MKAKAYGDMFNRYTIFIIRFMLDMQPASFSLPLCVIWNV